MGQLNTIGVDLAKSVIQVSVVTPAGKELANKALSRRQFSEFLAQQKPALVAFEACASAHFWARTAKAHSHKVRLLPAMSRTCAPSSASMNSPFSFSNFRAFHSAGLWLAVRMIPPSAPWAVTAISTVGVVESPPSITSAPGIVPTMPRR